MIIHMSFIDDTSLHIIGNDPYVAAELLNADIENIAGVVHFDWSFMVMFVCS